MAGVRTAKFESRCPDCNALIYVQGILRGEGQAAAFVPRHIMHKVPSGLAYARANKSLETGRNPQTLVFLQGCVKNIRGKPLEPEGLDG
jgi:hypothetical protein